eukprot:352847-Chlamydomonas_euryale.AAC.1
MGGRKPRRIRAIRTLSGTSGQPCARSNIHDTRAPIHVCACPSMHACTNARMHARMHACTLSQAPCFGKKTSRLQHTPPAPCERWPHTCPTHTCQSITPTQHKTHAPSAARASSSLRKMLLRTGSSTSVLRLPPAAETSITRCSVHWPPSSAATALELYMSAWGQIGASATPFSVGVGVGGRAQHRLVGAGVGGRAQHLLVGVGVGGRARHLLVGVGVGGQAQHRLVGAGVGGRAQHRL